MPGLYRAFTVPLPCLYHARAGGAFQGEFALPGSGLGLVQTARMEYFYLR